MIVQVKNANNFMLINSIDIICDTFDDFKIINEHKNYMENDRLKSLMTRGFVIQYGYLYINTNTTSDNWYYIKMRHEIRLKIINGILV
jgi:hypothetical protein